MILINSLWIGKQLSTMENLAISSHLKQGHEYHLWVYETLDVPEGTVLRNAGDIIDEGEVFSYSGDKENGGGSVSAFSNLFRYRLLKEQGGWWCDTDVVAIKPFDWQEPFLFASENLPCCGTAPTTCVIKVPQASLVMNLCYSKALKADRETVKWGEIGPKLLGESIATCKLGRQVVSPDVFCPIDYWDVKKFFGPVEIPEGSWAVHLWNEMWRRDNFDKDGKFYSGCLYETLKKTYGCSAS
jgi:hypothetical protein